MNKYNFIKISTYEHIDGFRILKREDTGQEVTSKDYKLLERIYLNKGNLLTPPKDANSLLFLEQRLDSETSLRVAYYVKLENMIDDGIRSFCKRKVFGINDWIREMRASNSDYFTPNELLF